MMSAAISIAAGAELGNVRPVSADLLAGQSESGETSFARSLNESVGASALSQGKSSADETMTALQNLKTATVAKKPNEVADIPAGTKGKAVAAQEKSVHGGLENSVGEKIVPPQTKTAAGPQGKATVGDSGTKEAESSADVEGVANDVAAGPSFSHAAPVAELAHEGLVLPVSIPDRVQSLVSSVGGVGVQKANETEGKTKEIGPAKKTATAQESAATPKTVQKAIGTAVNAVAIEIKPAVGSFAEGAVPAAGQAIATGVVPRNEISKEKEVFNNGVSGAVKPSVGVAPAIPQGLVGREAAPGANAGVIDTGTTVTTADNLVASPKPGTGMEKMTPVPLQGKSDGEDKTQGAPGLAAVMFHSTVGGAGASSSAALTAVVSGNAPGELTATKFQVGDAGAHAAGLPTGSREQDGVTVTAASMGGMPRMLTATPTALEVGIQNGTHGWLKVRAEMVDGGVVNASVSAASSAGQEMLHRELPALTAYLQEEKVAVNAVVVHAPLATGAESRGSTGMDGAGGQTPQRNNEGGEQQRHIEKATFDGPDQTMTYQSVHGMNEDGSLPLVPYPSGGSWLSVRA
jgi:hypothetical protein